MKKRYDYDKTMQKLKDHFGVKKIKDVIEIIDIPEGTVKTWSNNKSIPEKRLKEIAQKHKINFDWLAGINSYEVPEPEYLTQELIKEIKEAAYEAINYSKNPYANRLAKLFDAVDEKRQPELYDELLQIIKDNII